MVFGTVSSKAAPCSTQGTVGRHTLRKEAHQLELDLGSDERFGVPRGGGATFAMPRCGMDYEYVVFKPGTGEDRPQGRTRR